MCILSTVRWIQCLFLKKKKSLDFVSGKKNLKRFTGYACFLGCICVDTNVSLKVVDCCNRSYREDVELLD